MLASELQALGADSRYKMKVVEDVVLFNGVIAPESILHTLENFHEDGWVVCGTSAAVPHKSTTGIIFIVYRRKD